MGVQRCKKNLRKIYEYCKINANLAFTGRIILVYQGRMNKLQSGKGGFIVKKNKIVKRVFAIVLTMCMLLTVMPADAKADVAGVADPILYQVRNGSDVRFITYVDDYKLYSSVSFTLTIDGKVSTPLECTTAYAGIYAEGDICRAIDIYDAEGYFVAFTVNEYIYSYGGKEVTVTATYTTLTGDSFAEERTVVIGEKQYTSGNLTYANAYDWSSGAYQKNIFVYASATETATPLNLVGQAAGVFGWQNGLVLEYNEAKGTWKVVVSDLDSGDGANAAEAQTLGAGRMIIIFHNDIANYLADSYTFFMEKAVLGAEFYLSVDVSILQAVSGNISSKNVYLSSRPIEEDTTEPEEPSEPGDTTEPEDPVVGTIGSTIKEYTSENSVTASSGDTDGLSAVLYAPSGATGISTYLNLGAIHTTLYTSETTLNLQSFGAGIASDKDVDNAYNYLCMNSTNWSGDYGLIKRLGDADWEIVTSEYYYNTWRWNAYSYAESSGVTVSYDSDYVYWKWNVMDGRDALYIKNSEYIDDLQMNLITSNGTATFSICIDGKIVFSMSDTATFSNLKLGRAASLTNSSAASGSSNYLNHIGSTLNGKGPSKMTNVQFYDSYYYTSRGNSQLTLSTGSLWLYPNRSSNAGYKVNAEGDPIVTCEEVYLTDGRIMDIINIENY